MTDTFKINNSDNTSKTVQQDFQFLPNIITVKPYGDHYKKKNRL